MTFWSISTKVCTRFVLSQKCSYLEDFQENSNSIINSVSSFLMCLQKRQTMKTNFHQEKWETEYEQTKLDNILNNITQNWLTQKLTHGNGLDSLDWLLGLNVLWISTCWTSSFVSQLKSLFLPWIKKVKSGVRYLRLSKLYLYSLQLIHQYLIHILHYY